MRMGKRSLANKASPPSTEVKGTKTPPSRAGTPGGSQLAQGPTAGLVWLLEFIQGAADQSRGPKALCLHQSCAAL